MNEAVLGGSLVPDVEYQDVLMFRTGEALDNLT